MRFGGASALVTGSVAACAAGQNCEGFWLKPDPFDGRTFGSHFAVHNDGAGPALYTICIDHTPGNLHSTIARWQGHGWQVLNSGIPPLEDTYFVRVWNDGTGPAVYAAGRYGSPFVRKCWRWAATHWIEAPQGLFVPTGPSYSNPLCSYDDGTGWAIYGLHITSPARWTGSGWQVLGGSFNPTYHLIMKPADIGSGTQLIAVGNFTAIGSVPCDGAAAWDGQKWRPFGSIAAGVANAWAMESFDDGKGPRLYIGGGYYINGSLVTLARFNGAAWEPVPGAPTDGIRGLKVFDDGTGPALFVTGDFPGHIRKFDGAAWHTLGAGSGPVSAEMAVYNDGRGPSLFVSMAGGFGAPAGGGIVGAGTVQWVGCPNCYANCDNSTTPPILTANDFICFLNRYIARDPYANCDVDAAIEVSDFQCFLNRFASGCP